MVLANMAGPGTKRPFQGDPCERTFALNEVEGLNDWDGKDLSCALSEFCPRILDIIQPYTFLSGFSISWNVLLRLPLFLSKLYLLAVEIFFLVSVRENFLSPCREFDARLSCVQVNCLILIYLLIDPFHIFPPFTRPDFLHSWLVGRIVGYQ